MSAMHHLDDATLISYSSGSLRTPLAIVAATHLADCPHCRQRLLEADAIGGDLVRQQAPATLSGSARGRMLQRLAETPQDVSAAAPVAIDSDDADALPRAIRPYFGARFADVRWRTLAPGVHLARSNTPMDGGQLFMLRIAPGKKLPVHSHQGNELTLILRGAYDDALGHFGPGDVADLDASVEHQPVTAPGESCICLAATDAPLRFSGFIARALQPLTGL